MKLTGEILLKFALMLLRRRKAMQSQPLVRWVLTVDVPSRTLILFFSGGAMNPNTIFYLVEVAAAAALLGTPWTAAIVAVPTSHGTQSGIAGAMNVQRIFR